MPLPIRQARRSGPGPRRRRLRILGATTAAVLLTAAVLPGAQAASAPTAHSTGAKGSAAPTSSVQPSASRPDGKDPAKPATPTLHPYVASKPSSASLQKARSTARKPADFGPGEKIVKAWYAKQITTDQMVRYGYEYLHRQGRPEDHHHRDGDRGVRHLRHLVRPDRQDDRHAVPGRSDHIADAVAGDRATRGGDVHVPAGAAARGHGLDQRESKLMRETKRRSV